MKNSPFFSAFILVFGPTLFAASAQATPPPEAPIDMICVTEMPTTSFFVKQDKDILDILVLHHNGSQYAPITNSILTPNDLGMIKEQAEMVEKLGNRLEFKWKRSGCNADSSTFFQCVGEAQDFAVNGIKVHPWAMTVNEITQKNMWGTYEKKNVSFGFSVDQKNYQITMDYGPGDCVDGSSRSYQGKLKAIDQK